MQILTWWPVVQAVLIGNETEAESPKSQIKGQEFVFDTNRQIDVEDILILSSSV